MNQAHGFVRISEAWYARARLGDCAERVCISLHDGGQGNAPGELILEWHSSQNPPELRVAQHAWPLLVTHFSGLLRHLARQKDETLSPDSFCALLLRLGFGDMTPREQPANVALLTQRGR